MRALMGLIALAAAVAAAMPAAAAETAPRALSVDEMVQVAQSANPAVRAARARWESAQHSIKQAYAPNDPIFSYGNIDSPTNGISDASVHTIAVSEAFQFPGKAMLQTDQARRNAEIARLAYEAALRDIRVGVETAYYQLVLDRALGQVNDDNIQNLERVLKVTQVAYSANQVTQTDFITAEFDLAAARQLEAQYRTAALNDETTLNQLLYRKMDEPVEAAETIELSPIAARVDTMVDRAWQVRQEILQAALAERNRSTALNLAKMEYLPDFTASYIFDDYLLASAAPAPTRLQDHGFQIGFNVPIFFWLKQNEDVARARRDLDAAQYDLASLKSQTAAAVTALYRSAGFAYETALLYRDSLTPLARQNFQVALVAYQSGKIDFTTLAGALRRSYDARVSYLQAANQFFAGKVALEQTIGAPLSR
jgi:cobalt-zinc-cadmium efflux system outer membrane protein